MPTLNEITQALNNCMVVEPPVNYVLSKDASQLGTVYAEMAYFKQAERPLDALSPKQANAFGRWISQSPAAGAESLGGLGAGSAAISSAG